MVSLELWPWRRSYHKGQQKCIPDLISWLMMVEKGTGTHSTNFQEYNLYDSEEYETISERCKWD